MKRKSIIRTIATSALIGLPGCLVTQTGSLEVLNPKQAYGQSLAVVGDLHRENEAIERRLASDLQTALSRRGLTIAEDPAKADLVVVPTLGRMRERAPTPVEPVEQTAPVEASEPVVAAPTPEARSFNRFSSANTMTRGDRLSRVSVPTARVPASAQQAGLLLTAYRAADYQDYGIGRQSLPPVWRIYVSQPAVQMKWKSVAVPLINAAASAAAPLGKTQNAERKMKKEEPAAERRESREKKKDQKSKRLKDEETSAQRESWEKKKTDQKPSEARRREAKPRAAQDTNNRKDQETARERGREQEAQPRLGEMALRQSVEPDDSEAPTEKRKFLGLFGGSSDREKEPETEKPEAGN